jgi:uncharacterized lipoprotein YddW (UPF0748 family)
MTRARRVPSLLILSLAAAGAALDAGTPREVRGLWVVRTALASPASVSAMVSASSRAGVNTLIVQVRGRGDAYYASRHEPRAAALAAHPASFDPLAQVLREAHAAGLAVHAWVNVNLVADAGDPPSSPRHIANRHPEWLMVPAELAASIGDAKGARFVDTLAAWTRSQSGTVEGLFTSPVPQGAADYLAGVVQDLVGRYPVDGVHFDYVRYPGAAFDYSREALRAFRDDVERELPRQADRARAAPSRRRAAPPAGGRGVGGRGAGRPGGGGDEVPGLAGLDRRRHAGRGLPDDVRDGSRDVPPAAGSGPVGGAREAAVGGDRRLQAQRR